MAKAKQLHTTTNRRAFLSTMAIAVPVVVAGAALADHPASETETSIPDLPAHILTRELLKTDICQVDGNDEYVLFTMRVPRAAFGPPDPNGLVSLAETKSFGADFAAWIAARTQQII